MCIFLKIDGSLFRKRKKKKKKTLEPAWPNGILDFNTWSGLPGPFQTPKLNALFIHRHLQTERNIGV